MAGKPGGWPPVDRIDGKRVLITGATSGFGLIVAATLADVGADLIVVGPTPESVDRAREHILLQVPVAVVDTRAVDLAVQRDVARLTAQLRDELAGLDVLVNNAGVYRPRRGVTEEGIERTLATNVLAYHLMIKGLRPLLEAAPAGRVVNVASDYARDLDLEDLQFERRRYDGARAYRQSKQADRMLSWAWARRLEPGGVTVNAVAPGLVTGTGLYRETSRLLRGFMRVLGLLVGKTPEAGADTIAWLAANEAVAGKTGGFYEDREEKPCGFASPEREERLLAACEALLLPELRGGVD